MVPISLSYTTPCAPGCAVAQVGGGRGSKPMGYMAAACGSIDGCSKRDWSTLLLGLKQVKHAMQESC
jgi:hypothetical protein